MRIVRRAPRALGVLVLTALLLVRIVTAPSASAAGEPAPGRAAATCANERILLGKGLEVFDAFTLKHGISCTEAHALMTGYEHRATTGRGCTGRGPTCGYHMPGGWWCAQPAFDPSIDALCRRGAAGFTVVATSPPAGWHALLHLQGFELPDRSISCESDAVEIVGYTRCSLQSIYGFPVPAAWMEAPHIRVCSQPDEPVQPERLTEAEFESLCPASTMNRTVILAYGEENEVGGVRCVSAPQGMTCTFTGGAEAGKGFRINRTEVVQLG